jgi:hypothetical protein
MRCIGPTKKKSKATYNVVSKNDVPLSKLGEKKGVAPTL